MLLAGREEVLTSVDEALAVAALDARTPRPVLLVGPRGVGKTVLLAEVARRAGSEYGWPTLQIEMAPPAGLIVALRYGVGRIRQLFEQIPKGGRLQIEGAVLGARIGGVGGEFRFGRNEKTQTESPFPMEEAIGGLAEEALERESGFVLAIDELQAAPKAEFAQFAAMLQRAIRESWPMVVIGAGLPSLRESSSDVEPSLGYMERADWHELGLLDSTAARAALQSPAEQAGRPMTDEAADHLAWASHGYPFAVQLYGMHAWRQSDGCDHIDTDAARQACAPAEREMDRGLYSARWARASGREQEYLRAVAELAAEGELVTGRAVADRLGTSTRAASVYRSRLISKGTLVANGEMLDFAIPNMGDFVLRQPERAQRPSAPKLR